MSLRDTALRVLIIAFAASALRCGFIGIKHRFNYPLIEIPTNKSRAEKRKRERPGYDKSALELDESELEPNVQENSRERDSSCNEDACSDCPRDAPCCCCPGGLCNQAAPWRGP